MKPRHFIFVICALIVLYLNLGAIVACFPFDPKIYDYEFKQVKMIPIEDLDRVTKEATHQLRWLSFVIFILDGVIIYLAARLFYEKNRP